MLDLWVCQRLRYHGDGRFETKFMKIDPKKPVTDRTTPKNPFSTKDVVTTDGCPGNQFVRFLNNKPQKFHFLSRNRPVDDQTIHQTIHQTIPTFSTFPTRRMHPPAGLFMICAFCGWMVRSRDTGVAARGWFPQGWCSTHP